MHYSITTCHSDKKQTLKHTPSLSHSQSLMNDNVDIIPEPEPEPEPDNQHHSSQSIHGYIIQFSLS